jgi:hypothetical protein
VSLGVPLLNKRTPSTKRRLDSDNDLSILTHWIDPTLLLSRIALLNPSTTIKNNKGERGHPYLNPLVGLKNLDAYPFIRIAKEAKPRHPIIPLTIGRLIPTWKNINLMYKQLVLSYAFDK